MSDYKLPELPSDEELGITKEDKEKYKDEGPGEGGLSKAELLALLGDSPSGGAKGGKGGDGKGGKKKDKEKPPTDAKGAAPKTEAPRASRRGPLTLGLLVAMVALTASRLG